MVNEDEVSLLYSSPTETTKVRFPYGNFRVMAEIFDEAGAYSTYEIADLVTFVLPDEDDYYSFDVANSLSLASAAGDQFSISQILAADVNIHFKTFEPAKLGAGQNRRLIHFNFFV